VGLGLNVSGLGWVVLQKIDPCTANCTLVSWPDQDRDHFPAYSSGTEMRDVRLTVYGYSFASSRAVIIL